MNAKNLLLKGKKIIQINKSCRNITPWIYGQSPICNNKNRKHKIAMKLTFLLECQHLLFSKGGMVVHPNHLLKIQLILNNKCNKIYIRNGIPFIDIYACFHF